MFTFQNFVFEISVLAFGLKDTQPHDQNPFTNWKDHS